jgi:hypothetical protein
MLTARAVPDLLSLRVIFGFGILFTLGLVGYGRMLVPATNTLSVAGAALVLVVYAIIIWIAPDRIREKWPAILPACASFGVFAGFIFVSEVVLEYIFLPADNSRMGFVEFGLVFFIYALAAAFASNRYRSVGAGSTAAVATAMISSLIWFIAVLTTFYCYYGSPRQELVFRAEGNYEDFARSGMTDFSAFTMEDFFGAGFYHLLLGPFVAAALGAVAGSLVISFHIVRRAWRSN